MMSGGPIEGFTRGWAVVIGRWGAGHFFERDQLSWCDTMCRSFSVRASELREIGNWRRCKRCEAKLAKMSPEDLAGVTGRRQ